MAADRAIRELERRRRGGLFASRKNRVFRSVFDGRECVVKVFREGSEEAAPKEFRILRDCSAAGVPVPGPIDCIGGAVLMEFVPGEPVSDLFDRLVAASDGQELSEGFQGLACDLAGWLSRFHSAFGFETARGDAILRNFLMAEGGVVGLDFEEAARGDTLSDIGQLCASALMTDPPFTQVKVSFARDLASRYWERTGRDRSVDLPSAVAEAIRHYAPYRRNARELMDEADRVESGVFRIA